MIGSEGSLGSHGMQLNSKSSKENQGATPAHVTSNGDKSVEKECSGNSGNMSHNKDSGKGSGSNMYK